MQTKRSDHTAIAFRSYMWLSRMSNDRCIICPSLLASIALEQKCVGLEVTISSQFLGFCTAAITPSHLDIHLYFSLPLLQPVNSFKLFVYSLTLLICRRLNACLLAILCQFHVMLAICVRWMMYFGFHSLPSFPFFLVYFILKLQTVYSVLFSTCFFINLLFFSFE